MVDLCDVRPLPYILSEGNIWFWYFVVCGFYRSSKLHRRRCMLIQMSIFVNVILKVFCLCSFRQLQVTSDSSLSELNNKVKLKVFESERTQLVHEETCQVLKQAQIDNDKLTNKLEV